MVTDAQVKVDGNRAHLQKGASTLELEVSSPKDAVFDTVPTTPPLPAEDQNKGTQKLVVRLKDKVTTAHIEVTFK